MAVFWRNCNFGACLTFRKSVDKEIAYVNPGDQDEI